jgi:transcriptional regulator with XRE-family HTH domain
MIHQALKLTREFHRMKQVDLAKKLDISTSYLSEIESGKKPVSVETIENYARVFGVPASTFFLFEEQVVTPVDARRKLRASKLVEFFAWVVEEDADEEGDGQEEVAEAGKAKEAVRAESVRPLPA